MFWRRKRVLFVHLLDLLQCILLSPWLYSFAQYENVYTKLTRHNCHTIDTAINKSDSMSDVLMQTRSKIDLIQICLYVFITAISVYLKRSRYFWVTNIPDRTIFLRFACFTIMNNPNAYQIFLKVYRILCIRSACLPACLMQSTWWPRIESPFVVAYNTSSTLDMQWNATYFRIYRIYTYILYVVDIDESHVFCIHLHSIFTLMIVDSSARCFLIRVISPFYQDWLQTELMSWKLSQTNNNKANECNKIKSVCTMCINVCVFKW